MRRRRLTYTLALFALLAVLTPGTGLAATLSAGELSAAPGAPEIRIPIALEAGSRERVGGLQFDLTFDTDALSLKGVVVGAAAKDAAKDIYFSPLPSGSARVIVAGLNQNEIASGLVAEAIFAVAADVPQGEYEVRLDGVVLSDPFGNRVRVKAVAGLLQVGGDTNGAGFRPRRTRNIGWAAYAVGAVVLAGAGFVWTRRKGAKTA
ncbi:MAG: hypothetical protein GWP08_18105 [Nitrospiraceae bacterium]|nr:hypothetical protein [Nitrospiraceae bacterium]